MACHFLDRTPLEIRNEIYSYLLSTKYTKRPVRDNELIRTQKLGRAKRGLLCSNLYDFQPAILLTNKRINNEARRFLYDNNLFVLIRYLDTKPADCFHAGDLTVMPANDRDMRLHCSSSRISLQVKLGSDEVGSDIESRFVIAANDLWLFCKILVRLDNHEPGSLSRISLMLKIIPGHQLAIDSSVITGPSSQVVWIPRPLPQQRMLLEPFSTLHSIKNLEIASIDGKAESIDAQLIQRVKERAHRLPQSKDELLVTTIKIKDQGNEAFGAGNFWLACSLYKSARENLDAAFRYLYNFSHGSEFIAYFNEYSHLSLRVTSNTVAALLRLQQWSEAHEKAADIIDAIAVTQAAGIDVLYDPGELAKLFYRRALASEGMGRLAQAVDELREALSLDPKNMEMKAKLQKLKLQAKSTKQTQAALEALTL